MAWIRRLLFLSFLAGYLLLCPFLILYTLGIVIRPSADESIVKTGILFVASAPPGAHILIDGRPNPKDTPAAIVDLAPGKYGLRLTLDGYREWQHTLSVRPGDVTLADDILLMPERWIPTEASTASFSVLTSLGYGPYLLLRKSARLEEMFLYDIRDGRTVPVRDEDSRNRGGEVRSLVTVKGSSAFLFEVLKPGSRSVYLASIQWPKTVLKDLTALIPASYDRIEWAAGNPEDLFLQSGGRIDWIHVPTAAVHTVVAKNALGFGVSSRDLYILETDGILSKIDYADGNREILRSFQAMPIGFLPNNPIRIVPMGGGIFLLHGGNGTFSAVLPHARATVGGVRGFTADPASGTVLLWQAARLGILDLYARTEEENAPDPDIEPAWIWEGGRDIRQAWFVHRESHVLFRDGSRALLLDADWGDGKRTVTEIAPLREGTSIHYADREGRLTYLEESKGKAARIEIVPRTAPMRELLQELGDRYGF